MKKLMLLFTVLSLFVVLTGCKDEPPSIRIKNERQTKANVQIQQSNSNTININDVQGGRISAYQDVAEGGKTATAVIQSESVSPSINFSTSNNNNYTIVILNEATPKLRVDVSSK
jgi:starvation-inducible outer membrane lipoprotein